MSSYQSAMIILISSVQFLFAIPLVAYQFDFTFLNNFPFFYLSASFLSTINSKAVVLTTL